MPCCGSCRLCSPPGPASAASAAPTSTPARERQRNEVLLGGGCHQGRAIHGHVDDGADRVELLASTRLYRPSTRSATVRSLRAPSAAGTPHLSRSGTIPDNRRLRHDRRGAGPARRDVLPQRPPASRFRCARFGLLDCSDISGRRPRPSELCRPTLPAPCSPRSTRRFRWPRIGEA